ncbi:MAG: hypothetical protein K2M17_06300 [Bacilli bacterium]|nr:hypothetical protein [Bacilli bacterium]
MNKEKKKDDFFDQMHNYRLDRFNRFNFVIMILMIIVNVPFFILCGIFAIRASSINYISFVALWVLFSFSMLLCLIEFIFLIQKNSAEFIYGKFSSGMIVFVISIIVAFGAIFTISAFLPNEKLSLIPAIIAAVATLFAAVLALMGIHYTMTKKQEERSIKTSWSLLKEKRRMKQ